MAKWGKYTLAVALFVWLASLSCMDLSSIRRESGLFDLSSWSVVEVGEHYCHEFYENGEHGTTAAGDSGEVTKKWGLMGGICDIGTLSAQEGCEVEFSVQSRRGEARVLLYDEQSGDIYDEQLEGLHMLSLPQGEYRIYFVGSHFSGTYDMTYDGGSFALPGEEAAE